MLSRLRSFWIASSTVLSAVAGVNVRRMWGAFLFVATMAAMTALAFRIREGRIFG
jgi:hypothetical protein